MNESRQYYLLPAFGRRRRYTLMRVFAALLTVGMLTPGPYDRPATAHAASTCTGGGNTISSPPPPLLNGSLLTQPGGLYEATAAQQQSLAKLEQQAVTNTLANHGLASSDATAVQT